MKKLDVQIWSDIACPWCYVGKRRLETALARFPHAGEVEIHWRSFELDPSAPRRRDDGKTYAERLGAKYGRSVAQAQGMIDNMTATAAKDGIAMRFDIAQSGNTFDAHRLVHLAEQHGKGDAAKERLFRAYMTEGQDVGDPDTLVRLGAELGLDEAEVQLALESGAFTADVRADETQARQLGISGVPFFVFGGKYGVSGAQPADVLLQVLTKVYDELPEQPEVEVVADGAVCGPDGCA